MSLLNCARKHRLQAMVRLQRCALRRQQALDRKKGFMMPFAATGMAASLRAASTTAPTTTTASSNASLTASKAMLSIENKASTGDENAKNSWKAMLLTFFAMLQPEQSHEVRTCCADSFIFALFENYAEDGHTPISFYSRF